MCVNGRCLVSARGWSFAFINPQKRRSLVSVGVFSVQLSQDLPSASQPLRVLAGDPPL